MALIACDPPPEESAVLRDRASGAPLGPAAGDALGAPALTGALGGDTVPATWRDACRVLAGCALPRLPGTDLVELAGLLADTELATLGGQFRHDDAQCPLDARQPSDARHASDAPYAPDVRRAHAR